MKITRQNLHKLLLYAVASFFSLTAVSCSNTKDPAYYNSAKQYRPPQQQTQMRQQYYNPPQYYQPYAVPTYYPPVAPRSRYYSNPYAIPAYGNYDSDYYYSAPNYANPYGEQQREIEEEKEKSAGVADDKI